MKTRWVGWTVFVGILGFVSESIFTQAFAQHIYAHKDSFELSLVEAERKVLATSEQLKASTSDVEAAQEQAGAGMTTLLPKLSLQGYYQYQTTIPSISIIPKMPAIPLGSNYTYSIGPSLNYTLWDSFSSLRSYQSLTKSAEALQEAQSQVKLQLLLELRAAYIRVQLALEELRLVNGSLDLSHAQDQDILTRLRAGAATRLDAVTSSRQVLNYELQFKQKQADLSSALKDLLALVGMNPVGDLAHPGPPSIADVELVLQLDSLSTTLNRLGRVEMSPPTDQHPQVKSKELLAEAADRSASSQSAKQLPTIQASASTALAYPNGPQLVQINQNTVGVTLSMPLYLGDSSWKLSAQKRLEADSSRHQAEQLKINLHRDFSKATEMLASLREQQKLAAQDIVQSEESAQLYYSSYKAGKNSLIDVQTANNQALQAKVGAARIDAQILNQLISLMALSGKESIHD